MHSLIRISLARLLFAAVPLVLAAGNVGAAPKAYVGNFKDNTVSVIDTGAGAVVATVSVVTGPHGMGVTPDGRRVFVSGDSSSGVSVIDTATDRVIKTIEVGKTPHGIAITPDGKTAYVTSQEPGKFALVVVDLASRSVIRAVALKTAPRDPEFSFDGKVLYFTLAGVNAIQVLDPVTDKIVAEVPTGVSPHIARLYRGATLGAAVVQGPGVLQLFDPATKKQVRAIAVGNQPHWQTSNDGKKVYVTNEGSNDVTVVDLGTGQKTTIPVGTAPRKVVVQPAALASTGGARVSIANFAFAPATLSVAAGETVTWVNNDGAPHGLGYKDGAKGVNPLLSGASFSRTFDKPGTYDYVCSVHPFMSGRVVVR